MIDMNVLVVCGECRNTQPSLQGFPNQVFCNYFHVHMNKLGDASHCEHFETKIITNADRIRGMTDEELAKWISHITGCPLNNNFLEYSPIGKCVKHCRARDCWIAWLTSPATNVEVNE